MSENTSVHLQRCLDRWRGGDAAARQELVNAACERLERLTRKMFRADGRLRRWEETLDVFQNALLRLYRALQEVTPASLREFFRLAAVQVRRELIDLARHHYGPAGPAAHHQSRGPGAAGEAESPPGGADAGDSSLEPEKMALWGEFHERAGALPEEEREVFELVYYQGLTHAEAARLLEVSAKTVQRRWQAACLKLHEALGGQLPGL
jgi:RNA polymerase sigma-70 factor (ECF subfamily)